jgi:hypothetical protein
MKTKIFSLLGAAVAVCTFSSCDVYAPSGYAYGGYGRSYYSSGYSPYYSGYSPYYRSYSRPVVIQSSRYPSYRSHHTPSSSWNWNRGSSHHGSSHWNNNSHSGSWHRSSSRSPSNYSRPSSSWLNNRTTTSVSVPSFRSGLSARTSTSLGSSGRSWSHSGRGHDRHRD